MKKFSLNLAILSAVGISMAGLHGISEAGGVSFKDGDKYVKLGGRIQVQYHYSDPESGDATDTMFFRRFRPFIEGSVHKGWKGKFQWDMGKAAGVAIKDAFMQYEGIKNVKIALGNKIFPFSRENITSSKKQQLVERTFVGDHNYGSSDRNIGIHASGKVMEGKVTWGASFAKASLDPDDDKLDFDTPVNKHDDWNEGWITGGRVDFHPLGQLKFSQGDFSRKLKATIGAAAFYWKNDKDNITRTTKNANGSFSDDSTGKPDVKGVTAFEISGGIRASGFSADAQLNIFDADTLDENVTSGIYKNGKTSLVTYSLEGGYMVWPSRLEIVAGYEGLDADNYKETWSRTSFGLNYYLKKHDIKTQLTYRSGKNIKGKKDSDLDEIFFQAQYVF